ncbi:MAG: Abi family protein [Hyphomicrobiales bacterium]|nr:Abi family protein [Hyphomicrobiales bacterium]
MKNHNEKPIKSYNLLNLLQIFFKIFRNSRHEIYSPNHKDLENIRKSLSKDRFARYLAATDGNRKEALYLYAWNAAIGAAFHAPLQALEVTLRNQVHEHLTEKHGVQWYDHPAMKLGQKNLDQLELTKSKLKNSFYPISPSNVIESLSFGFWTDLFTRSYEENLWHPTLCKAFPYHNGPIERKKALNRLTKLKRFRNSVAHHEAIFQIGIKKMNLKGMNVREEGIKNLRNYYQEILETIGWMSPSKKEWVEAHSRVEEILARPQTKPGIRF